MASVQIKACWAVLMLVSALFISSAGLAQNDESVIDAIHDGHSPYLVVRTAAEGNSPRKPGIYRGDQDGNWIPMIMGEPLAGQSSRGIITQFESTRLTNKYEMLAVVNGELVLFNYNSSPEAKNWIRLGKNQPIVDLSSFAEFQLDPISSLQDVNVLALPFDPVSGIESFLVSVRQKNSFGEGITFLVSFGTNSSFDIEIPFSPRILDYRFRHRQSLQDLVANLPESEKKMRRFVVSSQLLKRMKNTRLESLRELEEWKSNIHQVAEYLERDPGPLSDSLGSERLLAELSRNGQLPVVSLDEGEVVMPRALQRSFVLEWSGTQFEVTQFYQPLTKGSGVLLRSAKNIYVDANGIADRLQDYPNQLINYDVKLGGLVARSLEERKLAHAVAGVLSIDGNRHLVVSGYPSRDQLDLIALPSLKIDEISSSYAWVPDFDLKQPSLFLLHSLAYADANGEQASTLIVYRYSKRESGLHLEASYQISAPFMAAQDLANRLRLEPDFKVYLDLASPFEQIGDEYFKKTRETQAFVDLSNSTQGEIELIHLKPLESFQILPGLQWRIFDQTGAIRNTSGLFYEKLNGELIESLSGEVLIQAEDDFDISKMRLVARLRERDKKTKPRELSIISLDPTFSGGKNGFKVVAHLEGAKREERIDLSYDDLVLDYQSIQSMRLFSGYQDSANRALLLIHARDTDSKKTDSIIPVVFTLKENGDSPRLFVQVRPTMSFSKEMDPHEVEARMGFDKNTGGMYWILTPDRSSRDPQFKLRDLLNDKTLMPNASGEKRREILYGAEAYQAGFEASQSSFANAFNNPWVLHSMRHIKRLAEVLEKEKERIISGLRSHPRLIAQLVDKVTGATPTHEIIVVSEDEKQLFKQMLAYRLEHYDSEGSDWQIFSGRIRFAVYNAETASQFEVLQNLRDLSVGSGHKQPLLLADAYDLLANMRPGSGGGEDGLILYEEEDEHVDEEDRLPTIMELIAAEGLVEQPKDLGLQREPDRLSALVIATPEELDALFEEDPTAVSRFRTNTDYLFSKWKVWPPKSPRASDSVKKMARIQSSNLESEIFAEVFLQLEQLASPKLSAQHKVFIVPEEMKKILQEAIVRSWVKAGPESLWSSQNPNLHLFNQNSEPSTQREVLQSYQAMRGASDNTRSVLLSDAASIIRANRPQLKDSRFAYLLRDPASSRPSHFESSEDEQSGKDIPPHMLWLMAAEGQKLNAEDFETQSGIKKISTLIISTEKEWRELQNSIDFENRFGLAQHFEIAHLEAPSVDRMKRILDEVFLKPEIAALRYEFVIDNQEPSREPPSRKALVAYLVNKTITLAHQFDIEPTSAFMRVLQELSQALVEDQKLRTSRKLDRSFMERLLTRVFNIPLNIATLEPDDPLVRLSDTKKMAFELQEAGYLGPLNLKVMFVDALLAQVRGTNSGRRVPSSVILLGETSTGKTLLFEKLVEVLGLQPYDFSNPNDPDANALIIPVGEITSGENDSFGIKKVIEHIKNFLALPMGYRGYILFDDMHKAGSPEILRELIAFQNSLFEAKDGNILVSSFGQDFLRPVPVGSINMVMTLNPTEDSELQKRYNAKGQDVDLVVASLARDGVSIDRSYVMRWTTLINLNLFPVEAKGPALQMKLHDTSQSGFNLNSNLTLFDPTAVKVVSDMFPETNAREFLPAASESLTGVADKLTGKDKIRIVVPKDRRGRKHLEDPEKALSNATTAWEGTGRQRAVISSFIDESMTSIALKADGIEGRLLLISLMSDTIRTLFYQNFVTSLTQDVSFIETPELRENLLAPMLAAVIDHLKTKPVMPLSLLQIDPRVFGARSRDAVSEFDETLRRLDEYMERSRFYPIQFGDEVPGYDAYRQATDRTYRGLQEHNRAHVIADLSKEFVELHKKLMALTLRVNGTFSFPSVEDWLTGLDEKEPHSQMKALGDETVQMFRRFQSHLFERHLFEMKNTERFEQLSIYDSVRLFLLSADRALSRLPWLRAQEFVLHAAELATQDLTYGQLPGVQHYLFRSGFSVFRAASKDFIVQLAESSDAFRGWPNHLRSHLSNRFDSKCSRFLVQFAKSSGGGK